MKKIIKLYKLDGDKKWLWEGQAIEGKNNTKIIYTWGLDKGKKQVKIATYNKGKNIGKKNETTHYEQAVSELESKANKKIDKGYVEIGEKIKKKFPLPMLAYKLKDHTKKCKGKIYIQPKLDGLRCVADVTTGELRTRRGKKIISLPHISSAVKFLNLNNIHYVDGELYSDELTFQEMTSIIKREKELHTDREKIKFHIFDIIEDRPFSERFYKRYEIGLLDGNNFITPVWTIKESIEGDVLIETKPMLDACLSEGYEGIMIRRGDEPYKLNKRSSSLLKYKLFIDDEFEIIGFEKEKHTLGRLGKFVMKTKSGKTFEGRPSMSHKELEEIWKNKEEYIGALATVRFQELTDDGIPRFPVVKGLRWVEDK